MGRGPPRCALGLGALAAPAALALLAACTAPTTPAGPGSTPPAGSATVTAATSAPALPTATPPSPGAPQTFFSPTDTSSFSMAGPFQVEQALQDPFSNLIQRGVLHEQLITLDVVGTPDYPVPPGQPGILLFGTCKCPQRGQGMHLTVEDGSALSDADAGAVRIRGTFRPVQTESDAFTLARP